MASNQKEIVTVGLSGLKNIGNTCYMNSILQCLMNLMVFAAYIRSGDYEKRLYQNKKTEITTQRKRQKTSAQNKVEVLRKDIIAEAENTITHILSLTMQAAFKENVEVEPRSFKKIIGEKCPMFAGYDQNDAQELLNFILDQVHEDTKADVILQFMEVPLGVIDMQNKRKECESKLRNKNLTELETICIKQDYIKYLMDHKDNSTVLESYLYWKKYLRNNKQSVITDLFTGMFYSKITCDRCCTTSDSFEPFNMLSVQVKEHGETTVDECLKAFCEEEKLTGINQYSCPTCKSKQDASKKLSVWEAPEYLIIHLKRFKKDYGGVVPRISKITSTVTFPLEGLTLDQCYSEIHKKDYVYDLTAISEHSGSTGFGHYVAHCKNAVNGRWYEFNDSRVFHVPNDDIEKEIISKNAYILFYSRRPKKELK